MAKDAELTVKIGANSKAFSKELDKVARDVKKRNAFLSNLDKNQKAEFIARERKLSELIDKRNAALKRGAAIGFAVVAAGIAFSIKSFADFEQGLAGVSKTTNIVGDDLEKLGDEITEISKASGISTNALLTLAQSAGQMGITGTPNIVKFTKAMATLEKTTNIAGETGAIAIAQLVGLSNEDFGNIDRISSVIVDLGNNFATLEDNIVFTASEIAGAGSIFGITATQALSLAAAFSELKVPPELARTAITLAMGGIRDAIRGGGEELEVLQEVTGQTADQLKESFGKDATVVFQQFIDGLARMEKQGVSTDDTLKAFNLQGLRMKPTFQKLAAGSDVVRDALLRGKDAYDSNTFAQKELAVQLDTTQGRLNQAKQRYNEIARDIGKEFNPVVTDSTNLLSDLAPVIKDFVIPALKLLLETLDTLIVGFSAITDGIGFLVLKLWEFGNAAVSVADNINNKFKKTGDAIKASLGFGDIENNVVTNIDTKSKPLDLASGEREYEAFKANIERKKKLKDEELKQQQDGQKADFDAVQAKEEAEQKAFEANKTRAEISALLDNENRTASEEQHLQSLIKKEQADIETETRKRDRAILANLLDNENRTADEEASLNSLLAKEANEIEIEERKLERETEKREAKLELEQEQFEEDLERLNERLSGKRELEDEFTSLVDLKEAERLKNKAKGTKDEDKADKAFAKAKIKTGQEVTASLIASTTELFDKKTAIGQAAAIADKAMRISESIQFTYTGATRALADYPAPYSYGVAAATVAAGLANVATISGAADGGMVHGGVFGRDTEPFLLAKGEAIVPSKLNPLSTDFEGEFGEGGLGGFGGGQNVQVEISLTDDAARFITAGQREDSALGV